MICVRATCFLCVTQPLLPRIENLDQTDSTQIVVKRPLHFLQPQKKLHRMVSPRTHVPGLKDPLRLLTWKTTSCLQNAFACQDIPDSKYFAVHHTCSLRHFVVTAKIECLFSRALSIHPILAIQRSCGTHIFVWTTKQSQP